MADFLSTTSHIVSSLEQIAEQAKEFVYLVSKDFSTIPQSVFVKLWEALGRNVRVVFIYDQITDAEKKEILFLTKRNVGLFQFKDVNTNFFMNEKMALVPSFHHFSSNNLNNQFAISFKKLYSSHLYEDLLNGFRTIHRDSQKMVLANEELVSYESLLEKQHQEREIILSQQPVAVAITPSTKKLSIKQKQLCITQVFERECSECTIKQEGADRLRLYGKGIALALSKERVDIIFVHYDAYQSKLEDVKSFILTKHPDLQVWFQYNRINIKLETESEIVDVFPTFKQVILSFSLIMEQ